MILSFGLLSAILCPYTALSHLEKVSISTNPCSVAFDAIFTANAVR